MKKTTIISITLVLAIVALFFANLAWGSVSIPLREVLSILAHPGVDMTPADSYYPNETIESMSHYIVMESRLPDAITALLAGAALATSGLLLQTAFRNPLAGPDVFGISSGAALAVAVVMLAFGGNISQMVGRLIENQQIHRLQQQLQDSQTGSFSTRQNLYLLGRILATKHECTQQIANPISDFALGNIIYRLENRKFAIEQRSLILSKIANLNIVS